MRQKQLPRVAIYTDGACRPNPGQGGWAALLRFGQHEKVLTGSDLNTTSNRMELQATISALGALNRRCRVDIYVDSLYLRNGITRWLPTWRARNWHTSDGRPVKNVDLWQKLSRLTRDHCVRWHWIEGHAGHPGNERVNQLAREALDRGSDGHNQ